MAQCCRTSSGICPRMANTGATPRTTRRSCTRSGITAVWLPPAYKGAAGLEDVGYGVYDTYDLGEFDQKGTVPTKYGTKDEYLKAVKAFQDAGVQVLADIVLNHRMGADGTEWVEAREVNPENRNEVVSEPEKIETYTVFNFPGRHDKYSDFHWDASCFDGVDWDASSQKNRIFEFVGKYWSKDVDSEFGNYDYLMGANVDFNNPKVLEELYRWGEWYLETTNVDGFRLDALKHIDNQFYENWLTNLRQKSGKELFTVGEYWSGDVNILLKYLDVVHDSLRLFDVPLHFNFYNASNSGGEFDMRKILDGSLVQQRPMDAVTFVGNHDTQPGQALQSWIEGWFRPLAYAIILLRQDGYPCVFFGDMFGIKHDNIEPVGEKLERMLKLRQTHAYGEQHDYFDHEDIIGWTREGDEDHPDGLAVILTNGEGGTKTMYVGQQHAGKTFHASFTDREVLIDESGNGTFEVDGGNVEIYTP